MSRPKVDIRCGICTYVWAITYIPNIPLDSIVCPNCGTKGYIENKDDEDKEIFG